MMSNPRRTVIYIGVTSELISRVLQHKRHMGSTFTKKYHCTDLLYHEEFSSIQEAIAREKQLKNWHNDWKWNLIREHNPELKDLSESIGINLEYDV
ncbi:GIY-YIG nuclease family protein [uncultured Roseivirga sp.]|uniref:GIY-YIG nuclease family protein n=1 Tax=uncultured Roseivirga sp. TaxID=543088 RepID=UPI00258AFC46|nr:GIY-YIG nuclease family protein [uncultured Roseivirga sp.]